MKIKYILIGLYVLLNCAYLQAQEEVLRPCTGCSGYLKDHDGDRYCVAEIHWYIAGSEPEDYILSQLSHGIDCNDNDATQTISKYWYVDNDGDTFGGDTRTSVKMCSPPEIWYVANSDDCDDANASLNPNTQWYADSDNDGMGDSSDIINSCIQPAQYVAQGGDLCPTANGEYNPSGCPTISNTALSDENYVYTRTLKVPITDLSLPISSTDMIETVTYFDGLGRPMQNIAIGEGGQGQDIIEPIVYDNHGMTPKEYLPYANAYSLSGKMISNPLGDLNVFYNNLKYDYTLNPFAETRTEQSSLGRTIEIGEPGTDWALLSASDLDHTVKYEYQTNIIKEVRAFDVIFASGGTESHFLKANGFYGKNKLYKSVVKNENWVSGSDNTSQNFSDNNGKIVLKREFNNTEVFNTYYVYDIYGNLSYVIPPTASDAIDAYFQTNATTNRNFPWTTIAQVDGNLAAEYDKLFQEYKNEFIANADLFNKYGGQGGFTLSTNANNELELTISVTTTQPLALKTGEIMSLKDLGDFKDTELARIKGEGYEYIFSIKANFLIINGGGKVGAIGITTTANTKLVYNKNYSWASLTDIDPKDIEKYQAIYAEMNNDLILTADVENPYGAKGGVNITIDENDVIAMTLDITATAQMKFKKGLVIPLNIERRIANTDLAEVSGEGFKYHFYIKENNIYIEGEGGFSTAQRGPGGGGPGAVSLNIPLDIVEGLCYEYHYDSRNRVIEKKVPGKGWEYIVYDKLNRPVITQDALMRLNSKWMFAKYDALNRIIYNGQFGYTSPLGTTDAVALRKEIQALVDANASLYESFSPTPFTNGGIDINYTSANFPDAWLPDISDFKILSVKYFDNYGFKPYGASISIPLSSYNSSSNNILTNVRSMETGSLIRVLSNADNWIFNTVAYDDKARLVWSKTQNSYLNTEDVVEIDLDFLGKIKQSKTTHNKTGVIVNLVTIDTYSYDHAERLLSHIQKAGANNDELITFNNYDDLGKLINNKVGGTAPPPSADFNHVTTHFQDISYTYNVRGWLKSINDPGTTLTDDLFAFGVNYNESQPGVTSLYNGNISQTSWQSKTDNNIRKYNYNYDALDRLTDANYVGNYHLVSNISEIENYTEGGIRYDKNGNITHLERYGLKSTGNAIVMIDNLDYIPNSRSNTIAKINDTSMEPAGFKDNVLGSYDYTYDINGNVTTDDNKGISNISYNYLNLPDKIVLHYEDPDTSIHPNGIKYIYDAVGNKLEKKIFETVSTNPTITTTIEYAGNYIYKNNVLQSFKHPEGYAAYNGSNFEYVYQYKDHLGNVRLSYKKNALNNLEVVEENNFYAFGLKQLGYNNVHLTTGNDEAQKFKYNGKELQEELKLNLYDYGARSYDPATGRWLNIDPLASCYTGNSPYNYALNNPIYFIDTDGYKPTPNQAARMAAYAYGATDMEIGGGWRASKNTQYNQNKSSGLKGTLFFRTVNGKNEYAFAYAGTDEGKESKADAIADLAQIIGLSKQYYEASKLAEKISSSFRNYELTFIGHSLGGGLANISSTVTGRTSMGFNSAWVSFFTNHLQGIHEVPLSPGNHRENYVHPRDPVTYFQDRLGFAAGLDEHAERYEIDSDFWDLNPGANHSIGRIILETGSGHSAPTNVSKPAPFWSPLWSKTPLGTKASATTNNVQTMVPPDGSGDSDSDDSYD
jgi:RHS repeat-associated protein